MTAATAGSMSSVPGGRTPRKPRSGPSCKGKIKYSRHECKAQEGRFTDLMRYTGSEYSLAASLEKIAIELCVHSVV